MRSVSWLAACCVLVTALCAWGQAEKGKKEPRVGWSLVLEGKTFRSAKDVEFFLSEVKAGPGKEPVREVELELRQGDIRVARWPYGYQLMLPKKVKDERKEKLQGYVTRLPEALLLWMGELPAGAYELAFLVNGVRATNVAAFRIDPAFEEAKAPVFEVGVLERPPLGEYSRPLLWVIGPEQPDRRITTLAVTAAPWRVDGVERKQGVIWAGSVTILAWGERYRVIIHPKNFDPPVDEKVAHDFELEFAGYKSNTLRVDPLAAPLGEAWDAAVVRAGPEWPVSVRGVVTDATGKPAEGYQVWLKTDMQMAATTVTDAQGAYALPGTLRHGMYELAAAKDKAGRSEHRELVAWQGKTLVRDFDFRNPAKKDKEPPPVPKGKLAWFDLHKVEAQLGKGLDVNARDENGNTALAMAITERKFDLARKLVEAGAEVNTTRGDHTSILALAIIVGDRGLVEYLLAKGADVTGVQGYDFMSPLMVAARKGSPELVEVLLDHGATAEGRSVEGMGVMEWAVRGGSPEVIALLAKRGADPNAVKDNGCTPLMAAAIVGRKAEVEALIAAGANVNASSQDGWTALGAASFGRAKDGDYPGVVRALLAAGARMDSRSLEETPVSQAAKSGRADLLKLFLEAGAKVSARHARRMMQEAITRRKYAVIEELAKLGIDVNTPIYRGYTALMYAAVMTNDPKAVKALITAGADVNLPLVETFGDVTPLLAAARQKNADVVRELIAAGAKVDVRDTDGKTPLDLARAAKNEEVVKVLKEAGGKEQGAGQK